jgi:hypothetical protein
MKKADQITGMVLLLFSLLVIQASSKMPQSGEFGPGYGFLPFWLGIVMAVLSVMLILNSFWQRPKIGGQRAVFPKARALVNVVALLGGLGVYTALLPIVGFSIATFLFLAFLMGIVQREKWSRSFLVSLFGTAGIYGVFDILLQVKLPENPFGF